MSELGTESGLTKELKDSVRREAISQVAKWTVGAVVVLFGLAATGWWLYLKDRVDKYIIEKAQGVPGAAVVAFDVAGGCPAGWTMFQDGAGRTIIGVGPGGGGLSPRRYRELHSVESITLTVNNIPAHQHDTMLALGSIAPAWASGPSRLSGAPSKWDNFTTATTSPAGKNPPDAISTMPPFIALVYCKKNG